MERRLGRNSLVHLLKVKSNNKFLAGLTLANDWVWELGNFTKAVPNICFQEYLTRKREGRDLASGLERNLSQAYFNSSDRNDTEAGLIVLLGDDFLPGEMFLMNVTELYSFMPACGNAAEPLATKFIEDARHAVDAVEGSASFNWIVCYPGASSKPLVSHSVDERRHEAQYDYYYSVWNADRERIYQQYLEEHVATKNVSATVVSMRAYNHSVHEATGLNGTIVLSSCLAVGTIRVCACSL
jgi:hypothetical protein